MSKKIRLGFIGCGKHGARHADAARELTEDFEIVAAHDIDPAAVCAVTGGVLGVTEDSAVSLIMRSDVDAVVIATPPRFHIADMSLAVSHGKHVLCEKPLWESELSEARAECILAEAAKKGLVVTSCHPRRFDPLYFYIKENMEAWQERWGKLVSFNFRFLYHRPSGGWGKTDSLLMDHLNHEIDLLHFLCGEQRVELKKVRDSFDRYDVVGSVVSESNTNISFSGLRRLESRAYCNELELAFERGRVRANGDLVHGVVNDSVTEYHLERATYVVSKSFVGTHSPMYSLRGIMRNFAYSIRGEEPNYLTHKEMIRNTAACTALVETGSYVSF